MYFILWTIVKKVNLRDVEIKNKLTVTRGKRGGDNREKEEGSSRNVYKRPMDKVKVGKD